MSYPIFPVQWDSRFFGFPVGRINLYPDYTLDALKKTFRQGQRDYRLLYVFLKGKGPDCIEGTDVPCPCYEQKIVFHKNVLQNVEEVNPHIRLYSETTAKRIEPLAVLAGRFSRFQNDPRMFPFYEQLLLTWISNSVQGDMADAVWTWQNEKGKPVGLVTIRCVKSTDTKTNEMVREGRIGMLAVEEAYRNQGIAESLLKACEYWAVSMDLPQTSIVTPSEDAAICGLCQKEGYTADAEVSVYHYWSPNWEYSPKTGWKNRE